MGRGTDGMTDDERERWLAEGQRWFDGWQEDGFPYDPDAAERVYELAGMDQSLGLAAMLKGMGGDRLRLATELIDLGVEEADRVSSEWKAGHGSEYHSFSDLVEFILHDLMENGMFSDGRTSGIDMAGWHEPNIANPYMMKGSLAYDRGDYDGSLAWQERALEINPVSAPIILEVSECHKKLGNMEDGINYAKRALHVAWRLPMVAKARRTIAFCEGEMGHHDLCAANLVISNDYEPTPIVANELLWLRSQGWTGTMDLATALTLAPEEVEGMAVSALASEAMLATLKLIRETRLDDHYLLMEVVRNVSLVARSIRQNPDSPF